MWSSFLSLHSGRRAFFAIVLAVTASVVGRAQNTGYWHTSGNQILDSNNQPVRIAGMNWYGFENQHQVVQGLWAKDWHVIMNGIKNLGYNTIRLPFSNQMVEQGEQFIPDNIRFAANGVPINTDLKGLTSLQVMDKVIDYAGQIGLRIILDNHRSSAGDGGTESYLWYTDTFPESVWKDDWTRLVTRYAGNPTVVGVDLRNEPHNPAGSPQGNTYVGACWGCGDYYKDWQMAAERGGNAVLSANPDLVIFVEGNDCYGGECTWWGGNLKGVRQHPVNLNIPNRLVYSAHEYGPALFQQPWFNGGTTFASIGARLAGFWGYISEENIAPVWVGEFGTPNTDADIVSSVAGSEGQWFQTMVGYLKTHPAIGWTYWAINGEDPYGLLPATYDPTPANLLKQQSLASIQSPVTGTPLRFVPVAPCRIVDTRDANATFGGPAIAAQGTRNFVVPQSNCNIPPNAQAYALNVTAVPESKLGWLTIWPSGRAQPFVSTLNSTDGRVKANAAIVPAGENGGVTTFATDNTHVILDIFGYFVRQSDDPGLTFYPLAPCRVADTRQALGPLGLPSLASEESRAMPVLLSNCGIPPSAKAYSLNFTAVPHGPLSYLTTWPAGQTQPLVSTLNATTGAVTANAAIVPAGANGDISVYAKNETDVIIDINGYFAPPASGGLSLYNVQPCRVRDTRDDRLTTGITGAMGVAISGGVCDSATNAQAYVSNATVIPQNVQNRPASLSYLTLYPEGQDRPLVSTLNAIDGQITSNMAIVPAGAGGLIDVYATDWTHFILDISGYFAP